MRPPAPRIVGPFCAARRILDRGLGARERGAATARDHAAQRRVRRTGRPVRASAQRRRDALLRLASPSPCSPALSSLRWKSHSRSARPRERYADLEHQLLEAALGKTILIDNLEELASEATSATANASAATARAGLPGPVEAGVTSSCVEDAFFVTQRCAKRALMTGHSGSACAVLNHVSSALTVNFLGSLNERLVGMMSALPSASVGPELTPSKLNQIASAKAAAASAKQAADALARQAGELARQAGMGLGVGSSGTDSSQLLFKVCVAMNNVEAAATYCVRMHDTLHHEAAVAYSSDNDQLSACIADLRDGAAERYQDALKDARARLASALRSSLSTVLSHAVANHEERAGAPAEGARESVGHRWALTENAFEVHDAIDEFGVVLGSGLTKVLGPMTSWLSRTNNHELLSHCAEHLARRFELSIRKCAASHKLTALGAIQLDKDVRALVNYFVTRSDNGYALREKLSRLLQLTKLLNSDTEEDAAAFSSAHLAEEDVRDAVKLREWP